MEQKRENVGENIDRDELQRLEELLQAERGERRRLEEELRKLKEKKEMLEEQREEEEGLWLKKKQFYKHKTVTFKEIP